MDWLVVLLEMSAVFVSSLADFAGDGRERTPIPSSAIANSVQRRKDPVR